MVSRILGTFCRNFETGRRRAGIATGCDDFRKDGVHEFTVPGVLSDEVHSDLGTTHSPYAWENTCSSVAEVADNKDHSVEFRWLQREAAQLI